MCWALTRSCWRGVAPRPICAAARAVLFGLSAAYPSHVSLMVPAVQLPRTFP
jgi:hypothetical protein